jgi:uncharacterized protein (DUF1800 family)
MQDIELKHLFRRARFGYHPEDLKKWAGKSREEVVNHLLLPPVPISYLKKVTDDPTGLENVKQDASAKQIRAEQTASSQLDALKKLWTEDSGFYYKMVIFWNDHLACRPRNYNEGVEYQNYLRRYAMADFGSLITAVSKSFAMMRFLNTLGNTAESPNENFARELLELFTLGIGHYTEQDIREAARAFTGWTYQQKQEQFFFNRNKHDPGNKIFLGRSGAFRGDDIINILLDHDRTSVYLTEKIYRYFVNPEVLDQAQISSWAKVYRKSGYRTEVLMREIFMSEHFYEKQHIGASIKSPIELLAGINRTFRVQYTADRPLLFLMNFLKQSPMMVPSVNGWPFQKEWIDQSTLMLRLRLGRILLDDGELDISVKPDNDQNPESGQMKSLQRRVDKITSQVNWEDFASHFSSKSDDALLTSLNRFLIPGSGPSMQLNRIPIKGLAHAEKVKKLAIELISTPDFQMC